MSSVVVIRVQAIPKLNRLLPPTPITTSGEQPTNQQLEFPLGTTDLLRT